MENENAQSSKRNQRRIRKPGLARLRVRHSTAELPRSTLEQTRDSRAATDIHIVTLKPGSLTTEWPSSDHEWPLRPDIISHDMISCLQWMSHNDAVIVADNCVLVNRAVMWPSGQLASGHYRAVIVSRGQWLWLARVGAVLWSFMNICHRCLCSVVAGWSFSGMCCHKSLW